MKKYLLILFALMTLICASVLVYSPLVHRGIIKASGRDQNIVSPLWARFAFSPASAIIRHRDLSRFRKHYLGTWTTIDPLFSYQITLKSVAFDSAFGQQIVSGESSDISLRDMVHHHHREPFGDPIMSVDGADDWYVKFKNCEDLILSIPAGDRMNGRRPMRRIALQKVAVE